MNYKIKDKSTRKEFKKITNPKHGWSLTVEMWFGAFPHGTVHRWGPCTAASCWKSIRTGQTSGELTLSEGSGASPSLEDSVCTLKWKVCSCCYDRSRIPHFQIQKLSYCGFFFKSRPSHNPIEMQPGQATIPSIPYRIIISYQTPARLDEEVEAFDSAQLQWQ